MRGRAVYGTVFRQTMFSEFEQKVHEMAEKGVPIKADSASAAYGEIMKRYYGPARWATHEGRLATEVVETLRTIFVVSACIFFAWPYAWRRKIRQSLREQLRLLGIPVCEKCGYDLRGSIEVARCPECGTPFDPSNLPSATPEKAPEGGDEASADPGR